MRIAIAALFVVPGTMTAVSTFMLPPPLKVPDLPADERAVSVRDFLTDLAEAGKRLYLGNCVDCHGEGGTGGAATRLDTMGFALAARRAPDLHAALDRPIAAHAELPRTLGAPGDRDRFNNVERLSKYLREVRLSRSRKTDD